MAGTVSGGKRARDTNLKNDPQFYQKLGHLGGLKTGVKKGFAANRELASRAGALGGRKSTRLGVKNGQGKSN